MLCPVPADRTQRHLSAFARSPAAHDKVHHVHRSEAIVREKHLKNKEVKWRDVWDREIERSVSSK